jgi:hypothetical protein
MEDDNPSDKNKPKTVNTTHNCFFSDTQSNQEPVRPKVKANAGTLSVEDFVEVRPQ